MTDVSLALFQQHVALADAVLRHRAFKPHGITTAAIFTLFVPPDMLLWHLVVVLSLGTVIGEHVFGGRGFAFLSPATVALALGLLSLPNMVLAAPDPVIALACIPGAVLLIAIGMLSVQIVLAFLGTLCPGITRRQLLQLQANALETSFLDYESKTEIRVLMEESLHELRIMATSIQ